MNENVTVKFTTYKHNAERLQNNVICVHEEKKKSQT